MIPEIERQYSQHVLEEAALRYGVQPEAVTFIGGFESFVYEYEKNGLPYTLKITSELRRSVDNLLGEAEWINYLANHGVPVCACIPSIHGRYVEVIPPTEAPVAGQRPSNFLAISYQKAEGHEADAQDWNEALFETFGAVMGRMHRVTRTYQVSQSTWRRQEWVQEEQLNARKYIPNDPEFVQFIEEKIGYLRSAFEGAEAYGLVHSDISPRNFFVTDAGQIQIFDFDDIGYHPFVNDIAIAWYYALNYPPREPDRHDEYVSEFIRRFLQGYRTENVLNVSELRFIPEFMNLRHALNYIIFHQTNRPEDLNEAGQAMLRQHRSEIMHGTEITRMVEEALSTLSI